MIIETTVYRACFFFEHPDVYVEDKILDKAFLLIAGTDIECVTTQGGPAWGPYVTLEGSDKQIVHNAISKIERYAKRFKNIKHLDGK